MISHKYIIKLGISNTPPPLTYFEQKAVKEKLFEHMEKKYEKRADYIRRMKPGVLDQTALDQQLADAKKRDSELVDEVAEKEAKLCGVLAECMELKADNPALQKKIELLKEQATKHEQRAGWVDERFTTFWLCFFLVNFA